MRLRKPHIFLIMVWAHFFPLILPSLASALSQPNGYAPGEILIKYKKQTPDAFIHTLNGQVGITTTRISSHRPLFRMRLPADITVQQAMGLYNENPYVDYAEPNYVIHINQTTPNDPAFPLLWGLCNTGQMGGTPNADIDVQRAWDISIGSEEVIVAVPDTGIDYTHDDLKMNIWINPAEIPENHIDDDGNGYVDDTRGWNFVHDDNDPYDDHGHGTHLAGTIGAGGNNEIGVVGINWHISIMPLKFLDANGSGFVSDAIKAIGYAVQKGARVINTSWGTGSFYSQSLRDAMEEAGSGGVIFVAAAGNGGKNNDSIPYYPSSYDLPNIISVASTNQNDTLTFSSNFGANSVDLGAPGYYIYSTAPGNLYQYMSGTSMATAHVSGLAGLVLSMDPTLTETEVKDSILNSTEPTWSLYGKTTTVGRVDAYNCLLGTFPARPSGTAGGGGGGGGCFVATAAYGSPMAKEVGILRQLRDQYLLPNKIGKSLVSSYYEHGPKLANYIAKKPALRLATRFLLYPVIGLSKFVLYGSGLMKILILALIMVPISGLVIGMGRRI